MERGELDREDLLELLLDLVERVRVVVVERVAALPGQGAQRLAELLDQIEDQVSPLE